MSFFMRGLLPWQQLIVEHLTVKFDAAALHIWVSLYSVLSPDGDIKSGLLFTVSVLIAAGPVENTDTAVTERTCPGTELQHQKTAFQIFSNLIR